MHAYFHTHTYTNTYVYDISPPHSYRHGGCSDIRKWYVYVPSPPFLQEPWLLWLTTLTKYLSMFIYIHTHTCMHTSIHIHTQIHTYMPCWYPSPPPSYRNGGCCDLRPSLTIYLCSYIHTYIHTYTYMHTYIHTYVYDIDISSPPLLQEPWLLWLTTVTFLTTSPVTSWKLTPDRLGPSEATTRPGSNTRWLVVHIYTYIYI